MYIYNMAKLIGKLFFRLYIYKLAKLIGKSLEIQTNNYRQLQTIIDVKQNENQHIKTIIDMSIQLNREHNYSKYHIKTNTIIAKKQRKNIEKTVRFQQRF